MKFYRIHLKHYGETVEFQWTRTRSHAYVLANSFIAEHQDRTADIRQVKIDTSMKGMLAFLKQYANGTEE
jgi:hypothetical protein